jgi:putative FmdB family regulatory protein
MPIYEYRCAECGFEQEYLQKVSDPLKTDCPACGKPALQKKLTAAGFQLKGSGWYVTDFRDGGKKTEAKKTEAKKEAGESKTDKAESASPAPAAASNDSSTSSAKSDSAPASKPSSNTPSAS